MAEWKGRALPPPDGDSSAAIALSKPLTPSELPLIAARPFVPGPVSARGGAGDMASTTATVLLNASPSPLPATTRGGIIRQERLWCRSFKGPEGDGGKWKDWREAEGPVCSRVMSVNSGNPQDADDMPGGKRAHCAARG